MPLRDLVEYMSLDAVVMSQDCDLEHGKLESVVLCPIWPEDEVRRSWAEAMERSHQTPTERAWRNRLKRIADGTEPALALLDDLPTSHGGGRRVVDFKDVYAVPVGFLGSRLRERPERIMLAPPFREHLSQSFARFFMRVGLPTPVRLD